MAWTPPLIDGIRCARVEVLLGVTQQTIYSIECAERRVRIDWLPVLTFRITADELLGLKPLPPPPETRIGARMERHIHTIKGLSDADQAFILQLAEIMHDANGAFGSRGYSGF
jgi:hypothetical protein